MIAAHGFEHSAGINDVTKQRPLREQWGEKREQGWGSIEETMAMRAAGRQRVTDAKARQDTKANNV